MINKIFHELIQKYNIKLLGLPNKHLGYKVTHEAYGSVILNKRQQLYLLLHQNGMQYCNPAKDPLPTNVHCYQPTDGEKLCLDFQHDYQLRVSSI